MAATLGILVIFVQSGFAGTSNLNPASDAFVTTGPSGNLSGNNYGQGGSVAVAAPGLPKGEFQSILQFDTSLAKSSFDSEFGPSKWNISSINLQLTATPNNNTLFNATSAGQFQIFWMQNDSWTEGTGNPATPTNVGITYNSLQNTFTSVGDENLGTFSYNGATSGANTYSLNLTRGFSADLQAGGTVSLRMVAADTSVSYLFNSRSFGTVANRPVLGITAVPEPGMLALGAIAIAAAAMGRKHVRRRR